MAIFTVRFSSGHQHTINSAADEAEAMSKAFMAVTQPIYCRIHEKIAEHSNAPVGAMGYFFPQASYPVSAQRMREIYVNGGYCIIPAEAA